MPEVRKGPAFLDHTSSPQVSSMLPSSREMQGLGGHALCSSCNCVHHWRSTCRQVKQRFESSRKEAAVAAFNHGGDLTAALDHLETKLSLIVTRDPLEHQSRVGASATAPLPDAASLQLLQRLQDEEAASALGHVSLPLDGSIAACDDESVATLQPSPSENGDGPAQHEATLSSVSVASAHVAAGRISGREGAKPSTSSRPTSTSPPPLAMSPMFQNLVHGYSASQIGVG